MSITRKFAIAGISAALVALGLQLVPASAGPDRRNPDYCRSSGPLSAASLPAVVPADECDITGRLITSGNVAVNVPGPGKGVSADAVEDGGESGLMVVTMPNGDVSISTAGDPGGIHILTNTGDPCADGLATGCDDPCVDTAHVVNSRHAKVKRSQPWWFNAGSRPNEFPTAAPVRDAIKAGTQNIVRTDNDCGLSDVVPKTAPYKGTTTRTSDMKFPNGTANGCKTSTDGKNTVDFGRLISPTIGFACTFLTSADGVKWFIKQADIRLRIDGGAGDPTDTEWTTVIDPNTCSDLWDVESVMTHERGHAFGLKHPCDACPNDDHFLLTMHESGLPCYKYARTLGRGDRAGLNQLY
jgi:hypothetical protein